MTMPADCLSKSSDYLTILADWLSKHAMCMAKVSNCLSKSPSCMAKGIDSLSKDVDSMTKASRILNPSRHKQTNVLERHVETLGEVKVGECAFVGIDAFLQPLMSVDHLIKSTTVPGFQQYRGEDVGDR